ncbi:MAG: hypothetical protein A2044_05455 [Candidatus Firestonebacteria bacterium GWA2_43_8]|nr:MAG: hypothetical protein A2044_05455 [Candidatus Firestonebacteria bacterium GWA2_43_8]
MNKILAGILVVACLNIYAKNDDTGSIIHGNLTRTFRVHNPKSKDIEKKFPLVIVLHGGGGTGLDMVKLTKGKFNELADKDGFIAVYPDGFRKTWNDGRPNAEEMKIQKTEDDVSFMSLLIDYFIKEYNVDGKRVYVTGISNGSTMASRLACELSEKITAVACVSGSIPKGVTWLSAPKKGISVIMLNGKSDTAVPWNGGNGVLLGKTLGERLSVQSAADFWINNNKCPLNTSISTAEPDLDPNDGTTVKKTVYGGGRDGSEVALYEINNGGHTWPGGVQYMPERFVGKTSRDINACEVIWEFFKKHSR